MSTRPSLGSLLQRGTQQLASAGIRNARSEAELIAAFVLNEDKSYIIAHTEHCPTSPQYERIQKLYKTRANRVPMSYVLGQREFYGRDFRVDERALTPRIETEVIVHELSRQLRPGQRLLDIGTGCGAIGLSLALEVPGLEITLSDISREALELSRENCVRLQPKTESIEFIESDLFTQLPGKYHAIAANLPYVSRTADLLPEVTAEPHVALFGGDGDGLDLYRRFFQEVSDHLTAKSLIYLESDPWQQPAIEKLAQSADLQKIFSDYFILGFKKLS